MRTRFVFLCLGLGCAATSAFASFELVMVGDSTTGKVHRFDGISGSYLGAFGEGEVTSTSEIAAHVGSDTCFIRNSTSGLIYRYNYNTGEFMGATPGVSGAYFSILSDGTFLTVSTTLMRRYNQSGTLLETFLPPTGGAFIQDRGFAAQLSNGRIIAHATNSAGTKGFTSYVLGIAFAGPFTGYTSSGNNVGGISASGLSIAFKGNFGTDLSSSWTFNAAGNLTGNADNSSLPLVLSSATDTAFGHANRYFVSGINPANAAQGIVARVDGISGGGNRGTFGTSILKTPVSITTVVAPEPGTMLALSAGIGLLVRKRRQKS
jgi:hypothetical protein